MLQFSSQMDQKQKRLRVFYATWAAVAHFAALFAPTVRHRLPRLPAAECDIYQILEAATFLLHAFKQHIRASSRNLPPLPGKADE